MKEKMEPPEGFGIDPEAEEGRLDQARQRLHHKQELKRLRRLLENTLDAKSVTVARVEDCLRYVAELERGLT